jgi:hypothetical protein
MIRAAASSSQPRTTGPIDESGGIVVLPTREVAVELIGVLVRAVLLPFREVPLPRVVNARVARLLALGKVAAVLALGGLGLLFLPAREPPVGVLVVVVVVVIVVVIVIVVVVVVLVTHWGSP